MFSENDFNISFSVLSSLSICLKSVLYSWVSNGNFVSDDLNSTYFSFFLPLKSIINFLISSASFTEKNRGSQKSLNGNETNLFPVKKLFMIKDGMTAKISVPEKITK